MLALFMKMSKLINYTTESSCTIYSYFNVEQRYGHVLRQEDDDWVKKCMEYEVDGPRPRGRPKRTWREVVREDRQARKMNKEDAIDHCK